MGLLGQGGMGAVYKARDPEIDRIVALKVVSPLLLTRDDVRAEFLERFRREARAAGRLSHPNIVSVYDLGTDEPTGTPFIVMEYVPGISLETVLRENPAMPVAQGLEILDQVAAALAEAHRGGVVHRDVKPANVFLDARGRVKVGDFGIARVEGSDLTQSGAGLGTPGYCAPEVLRGGAADARSDVFALGVLAYRVLTGRRPFEGPTREATMVQVLEHAPPPPAAVRPDLPERLSSAVMRALAKPPGERTPSVEAFAAEMRGAPVPAAAAGADASTPAVTPAPVTSTIAVPTSTVAVPTSTLAVPTPPAPAPRRRRRWIAILLGLAAVVAGAMAVLWGSSTSEARRTPPAAPAASRPSTLAPAGVRPADAPPPAHAARPAVVPAAPPKEGEPPRADPRHGDDQGEKKGRGEHDGKGNEGKGKKKGHGKGGGDQ